MLVALTLVLSALALHSAAEGNIAAIAIDSSGATIRLGKAATRIVALSPGAVETIFAIGAGDRIAYRGADCDYPERAGSIPVYSSSAHKGADLFVVDDLSQLDSDTLARDAVPVFIYAPKDFRSLADAVMALGILTGQGKEGVRVAAGITKALLRVRAFIGRLSTSSYPRVFWEARSDPLATCGSGCFAQALIAEAGGRNIFFSSRGDIEPVDDEEVLARDPQIVVIASGDEVREARHLVLMAEGKYARVVVVDPLLASRASPRSPRLLLRLAKTFHPGIVP